MGMYVIQVPGGRERHAAESISRVAGDAIAECFVPLTEVMRKKDGAWVRKRERLFPGYLFVDTKEPGELFQKLRQVPLFTRLLRGGNDAFISLTREEIAWLNAFTSAHAHVVELSQGVIEGDRVMVTSGPLKGHEAQITRIDRHKRLAYLDVHMFGRTKTVRVGLEIVSKRT